ncbi:unnamed protein product [Ambrosiozyma monospora]|uniref:Unnamed protein product n=1 Tax=Ambrosiozyma monospora TaxID=43982 RepID=A0ACB5UCQ2_AMBMO|nr:unnamed protein product [Ambrosiozyma monospora]
MFDHTHNSYGLNEILMSSAMGGIVFGLFAGNPLCIVGVTGPISIFNYTVYELISGRHPTTEADLGPNGNASDADHLHYLSFMCLICLWAMAMHFVIAVTNLVNYMRYATKFSCEVFGFFINIVYIQKGIQILTNQFKTTPTTPEGDIKMTLTRAEANASGFASVMVALLIPIL